MVVCREIVSSNDVCKSCDAEAWSESAAVDGAGDGGGKGGGTTSFFCRAIFDSAGVARAVTREEEEAGVAGREEAAWGSTLVADVTFRS